MKSIAWFPEDGSFDPEFIEVQCRKVRHAQLVEEIIALAEWVHVITNNNALEVYHREIERARDFAQHSLDDMCSVVNILNTMVPDREEAETLVEIP